MVSPYDKEAERLAALPRAERFEELIDFPVDHTFKVIGRREGLSEAVQQALAAVGRPDTCLVERPSAQGTYVSLTFTLAVASGRELDGLYTVLEALPGLAFLL